MRASRIKCAAGLCQRTTAVISHIMRHGTPTITALSRSMAMLEAILADRQGRSIPAIASDVGLPRATAHRQVATFMEDGFLVRGPGGRPGPGPRLLALLDTVDAKQAIVAAAAPVLHRLADQLQCLVQLGTFENDMVTYRIKTGQGAGDLFTRVGMQLEAYCTGIGKVLLAGLTQAELQAYLANGPFPALTPNTITDPSCLRAEVENVRRQGFGRDDEEIAEGLACIAVPVIRNGQTLAAISASRSTCTTADFSEEEMLERLWKAAEVIAALQN